MNRAVGCRKTQLASSWQRWVRGEGEIPGALTRPRMGTVRLGWK